MAFEIHTSQFWDGADQNAFENAVQNYINILHAFNMVVGKPRPTAHPLVERSIKRIQKQGQPDQYVADYIVIDDTPPPPSLEEKKNKLISELRQAEAVAMNKMLPQRKMRLVHLNHSKATIIPEEERTAEQKEVVESFERIAALNQKNIEIAAHAEAAIEDLTEETIASWQHPEFEHGS